MKSALEAWTSAIAIRKRVHGPDHPEVARLLAQTGVPWMVMGDLDRARLELEESLESFARSVGPDYPARWIPLNILADVENKTGNFGRDLDLLQEALRVVRLAWGDTSREALTVRANLSQLLLELGDYAGSRAIVTTLLPAMQAQYGPRHPRTISVRINLAQACRASGDTAAAMRHLLEIESILAARPGPPDRNLTPVVLQQAELLYRQGRDDAALRLAERILEIESSARYPAGFMLSGCQQTILQTLEESGDTARIDSARVEILRIGERHELAPLDVAENLYAASRADWKRGRRLVAWNEAVEAERIAREHRRVTLQALPDRRALQWVRTRQHFFELVLDHARGGDRAQQETAMDLLVRSRGMVRAELERRRPAPGFESDTAVAGSHQRWVAARRRLAQRLVSSGGVGSDSTERAALDALRATAETAEAVYARTLETRGTKAAPIDLGLADLRKHLKPGQALVACYQSTRATGRWWQFAGRDTGDVIAFVARGDSDAIERVELGTSIELSAAIDPWRERLAAPPGSASAVAGAAERGSRRFGARVRRLTWDRLAPHVRGVTEVFLVADGVLDDLPWQALPDGARGYLVENGPRIHVLNTERELAETPPPSPSRSLLAIGAPDYERDKPAPAPAPPLSAAVVRSAPDPCAAGRLPRFDPLPGSGREVEAVAATWRAAPGQEATVLRGAEASEAEFKRRAQGRSILHLATHGVVTSDTCLAAREGTRGVGVVVRVENAPSGSSSPSPKPARASSPWMARRVWLALAGANHSSDHRSDENEGLLTAEEVVTLDLTGTDWVVLSACHSGLAEAWSRDGALGMRRAFDLAGARTVIASSWAVEDVATQEWMAALYAARARGAVQGAAAMESANRAVLAARRKAGRSTHPFYWAAFSATGL
jgi:CHAT domain-containing protein/tetratricopeptide (TPR) repeat protein